MSEEFEDVSVDVSADVSAPDVVPVGGGTEAPVAVESSAEPVSEQPDVDQRVFDNNTKIGSAENNIRQDVAAENGTALGNGGGEGRAPVTARGKEEAENKKQEARAALIEQMEQAAALRKEKDENFGMSSHDLTKLLDFIANPELQEKLKSRLKNSMGEKRAEKAMAELNELHQLKKKQEKGENLTPEEQARLAELRKSEDLKVAIQQTQDMRNEMELKTNGAKASVNAKEMDSAQSSAEKANVGIKAIASFESYSSSGISANSITPAYNIAAVSNKNEPTTESPEISQANKVVKKPVEVSAGMGVMV